MEIIIGTPYLRQESEQVFLCARITIHNKTEEAWFAVQQEYARYLTFERSDAFVTAYLATAMRLGLDIRCQAPLTHRLHYQITRYLIPTLSSAMEIYRPIAIHAPITNIPLPCENAVGTGWSGGVDSMYTLMTHIHREQPAYRLTHLLIANVGTLESDQNKQLLQYLVQKARAGIARELDLSVVAVDSNLQQLLDERYLAVAVFRLPAAVLALQKLFHVFLHSGAYEFNRFAFVAENSAYYELLPLNCFETDCTVFYSTGSHISRIQKLKELSDFLPARKYLHPCIYARQENCGRCGKCIRTQGALHALGTLENFEAVFDLPSFYENKEDYFAKILANKESQHYGEVIREMNRKGITLSPDVLRKARILRAAAAVGKRNPQVGKD